MSGFWFDMLDQLVNSGQQCIVAEVPQMDKAQLNRLLKRGATEVIVEEEFVKLLDEGRPLRLKMGFDPSAPDLHIGHAVGLRKLRQLQEMGHKVVVIVGDWTAQIGDPSGQSATRPMLTEQEVLDNAETYLEQFYKVVDRDKTEIRMQSEWFGTFSLANVVRLTSRFTVAQFLARDDFATRFKANRPIAITELLYPLLQAYDSVAIESDVEFGGSDQKFNLLVGRDLQQMMGQRPQQCFIMPLLVGTDGVQKMSKSLGNYISLNESPKDMYGKTMSLPDHLIIPYAEHVTDIPAREVAEMRRALEEESVNPMEFKKRLACELVAQFHGVEDARNADQYFEKTVQRREIPEDVPRHMRSLFQESGNERLGNILMDAKMVESSSEAKRLINQGAVKINGEIIKVNIEASAIESGSLIQVGPRRSVIVEYGDG